MTIFVFLGPTLSAEDARNELDAIYLPPAGQGDVYRAAREQPFAIGLIDGYFEQVPSVWHKEILWALSNGIHVLGAASMGALRAAELEIFGMRGVGQIFVDFHRGILQDDDEVAVSHADSTLGFRSLSEAMVNIRATLAAAERQGILPRAVSEQLLMLAKRTFYPERSFPGLVTSAHRAGVDEAHLQAFQRFVASHRVDQKKEDAAEMLRILGDLRATGERPAPVTFSLAHTDTWERVVEWAEAQPALNGGNRQP